MPWRGIDIIADQIRDLLHLGLPGKASHEKMIPETRQLFNESTIEKQAAVLILLFPDDGGIRFSFIQRTKYDGVHSGQISLPGGIKEDVDIDLRQTAIRETCEETGISAHDIKILGKLSPINIPVSRFEVHPFVGYISCRPEFRTDAREVEFMINIPILHFLQGRNRRTEIWNLHNTEVLVPFFIYKNHKIWGATAMIISEFLDIIEGIEPDQWIQQYSGNDCSGT